MKWKYCNSIRDMKKSSYSICKLFLYINIMYLFIGVNTLPAQNDTIIQLEVINPGTENYVELKSSLAPVFFSRDTLSKRDSLVLEDHDYFDFAYRISYTELHRDSFPDGIYGFFRLFLNKDKSIKIAIDKDLDLHLQDEKIEEVNGRNHFFQIEFHGLPLTFELEIMNIKWIYEERLGAVNITPKSYFKSEMVTAKKDTIPFILRDDLIGVTIQMRGMNIRAETLNKVSLKEAFQFKEDKESYIFYDFNIYDSTVKLKISDELGRVEGYRKEYFVNQEILSEHLKVDVTNKPVLIYFWGIWCKPCMDKFEQTKGLYQELVKKKEVEMFFCSYNITDIDIYKVEQLIHQSRVDTKHSIIMDAREKTGKMSLHDFVKYDSLISLLKNYYTV